MTPIGNEPCPVAMAKQRARAAVTLGAVSFVAVGALAWIGLDAVRGPASSTTASASGPALVLTQSDGTQKALISRAEREIAAARQAILKSAGTNLELLDLSEVEQLTDNTRQKDPRIEAARLAILQNAGRNLELLDLNEVEELIGFTPRVRQPATATTELAAATQVQPEPDLDLGLEEIRSLAVDGGLQPSAAPEEAVVVSNLTPTSAAVAAAGTDCIADLREFAGQQSILFSSGSAELQGSELPTLRKIGRMAEACDGALIHVTGHSDSSGSDVINLALSWQRADNTVATLAALGVDTSKFEPVGFGARSPSAQGDSSDEELNRRVEFVVFEEVNHSQ
ncbi:OmpA family protein [uncultured Litoreibacter sp.]|uniref:OmpA family protein n=1 Tax=uncultured Litoreibacter sp. TaxID=1392394 RepID=UPI00260DE116|nr:OmpA family protein [uncultured Litoreibacter sp.]